MLYSDIVIWAVALILLLLLISLLIRQRKQSKLLSYELEQLDKMSKNNVESEFVLRAMKLSTWHLNPKTMMMQVDSDFKDSIGIAMSSPEGSNLKDVEKYLHPDDRTRVTKALRGLCEGNVAEYHEEYRMMIPATNMFFWEESYATVVDRDVEGKPTSIVGTTMHIGERKEMETALIDALNKAEESDKLKSAFIANMSHEIRTPLNGIVGFASVLSVASSDEERQSLVDLIQENTHKLLNIIDNIVNLSKIESGQDKLNLTEFEINTTIADLADGFRGMLKPGVELKTVFPVVQQQINSDHARFCEIIRNLLSNAVKFTKKGSIAIGYDKPKDNRMQIWVKDTGIGIADEHLEHIFDRFFKENAFEPGTGLGLSVCRTMASSLGGTIKVSSKQGEGSTFVFDFPLY
ncbi:MAG: PAS domain-containing sensor histidine kinase [Prevotella sp.]|nr:PAS domain-containing sensor histidine kinase [Prevotella sp.]